MKSRLDTIRTTIVLLEDQLGDALLFKKITAELIPESTVHSFASGTLFEEWIQENDAETLAKTALIFFDINLPQKDGFYCLKIAKNIEALRFVPKIFFSTSSSSLEVHRAYEEGAQGYIVKPLELQDFRELLAKIYSYWLDVVVLPELSFKLARGTAKSTVDSPDESSSQ